MTEQRKTEAMRRSRWAAIMLPAILAGAVWAAEDFSTPYSPPRVERENVFEFTAKPAVLRVGEDRYEITFAVRGYCDATVGIVDEKGAVLRHLASGVLGPNAPAPFQKNTLSQTIHWNGKDDLESYPKDPGRLKVRVMLGLKPVFDKRLGGTSPKHLPGTVKGLTVGPDGAYVIWQGLARGFATAGVRKFDHDGNYAGTLVSPSSNLPESRLNGMGFVEYAPGKKALQGPDINATMAVGAFYLPPLDADGVLSCQPTLAGNRLVFPNPGFMYASPGSFLHYLYTDGGRDMRGTRGLAMATDRVLHRAGRLAASPDGKTIYLSGAGLADRMGTAVYARALDGEGAGNLFAGKPGTPGSDDFHFNNVQGIDCDAAGRVYVADSANNRIQVFSPGAKLLKSVPMDRPELVGVHKKTGEIYVLHAARVEGRNVGRVTKLAAFDNTREVFHADGFMGLMALDSWSARPRLWFGGRQAASSGHGGDTDTTLTGTGSVTIWEERDGKLENIADFEEEARRDAGKSWFGLWPGMNMHCSGWATTHCDPTRETLYYRFRHTFNMVSGEYEGQLRHQGGNFQDLAFDKRGYMHGHQNPTGGQTPCVWRVDPSRAVKKTEKDGSFYLNYPEIPYDYGVELKTSGWGGAETWLGALATKCQPGAKGFQDGMGVNMKGEIVVGSNIYFVPKMADEGLELGTAGPKAWKAGGRWNEGERKFAEFLRSVQDKQLKGESVYFVKRQAGIPLAGATMWVFDRTGELRQEAPAVIGGLIAGQKIDEDGFVQVVMDRTRRIGGRNFLADQAGHFGEAKRETPFTGMLVKTRMETLKIQLKNATIPMDAPLQRPPDFSHPEGWIEGAEWLSAGASPIVPGGCSCPSSRFHLDWYKRAYVPEAYRHSIGILDANGNLIMHLGRYGNFDEAPGGQDGVKPGGTDIALTMARYLSGTDNYLAFEDWGEKIIVLKLDYQAAEIAPIKMK